MKRDLQKRPTTETSSTHYPHESMKYSFIGLFSQKRPKYMTKPCVYEKRPTKETYNRDLVNTLFSTESRILFYRSLSTKETHIYDKTLCLWKEPYKRDLRQRPRQHITLNRVLLRRKCHSYYYKETCIHEKRPTKETYNRGLINTVFSTEYWEANAIPDITFCWKTHIYIYKETYKRDLLPRPHQYIILQRVLRRKCHS